MTTATAIIQIKVTSVNNKIVHQLTLDNGITRYMRTPEQIERFRQRLHKRKQACIRQ